MYILTDEALDKLLIRMNRPRKLWYSGSTFIPLTLYALVHVNDNSLYTIYDTKEKVFKDVTLDDFMKQSNNVASYNSPLFHRFRFSHICKRTGKSLEVFEHSVSRSVSSNIIKTASRGMDNQEGTFMDFATVNDKSIKFLEYTQSITLERKRPKDKDILVIDRKVGDSHKIAGSFRNNFYQKDSFSYKIYNKISRPLLRSLKPPLLSFNIDLDGVSDKFSLSYEVDLLGFMILLSEVIDLTTNGVAIHVDYLTRNKHGVFRYNTSWLVVKFKPSYKAFITKYLVLNQH